MLNNAAKNQPSDSSDSLDNRYQRHKLEVLAIHNPSSQVAIKRQVGKGKGTFVDRNLFESDAFLALRGVAPQMLIYLLGKRIFKKDRHGKYCPEIEELRLSYIELRKLGISQPRATRGFDELLAKGFIDIVHQGGGFQRDQSIYRLSQKYLYWRKGAVLSRRVKGCKKGFQGGPRVISTNGNVAHQRKRQRIA
jgi:hypothetical protein